MAVPRPIVTLRHLPDDEDSLRRLDRLAGGELRAHREHFLAAVRDLVTPESLRRLRRALERGSTSAAVEAYDWPAFTERMRRFVQDLGETTAKGAVEGLRTLPANMPPTSPTAAEAIMRRAADQWVRSAPAAELVREVVAETRAGIRAVLEARFRAVPESIPGRGIAARRIVDVLRADQVGRLAGLTESQAGAVMRKVAAMTSPESSPRVVANLTKRFHGEAVRRRARVIADTETYAAITRGKQAAWGYKVQTGQLDPSLWEQEWVTRIIDSCERCIGFDDSRAELMGGVFVSKDGERSTGPTLHPRCVCVPRIARKR